MMLLILFIVPTVVGTLYLNNEKRAQDWLFAWCIGNITLLAGFLPIAMFFIVKRASFNKVVFWYSLLQTVLVLCAVVVYVLRRQYRYRTDFHLMRHTEKQTAILWFVFLGLLAFQLIQCFRYSYGDGDDAFYVAISTYTERAGRMYEQDPYTGSWGGFHARYALAPFPIWIAYLARITGIQTVIMARTALPPVLIAMSYVIYILLADTLFPEKKSLKPVFMILLSMLVLFGDYSSYSTENFLLARSRQGKSALGNIFLPMLVLLFMTVLKRVEEQRKIGIGLFAALLCTQSCMCLSSTMGAFLGCIFAAIAGIAAALQYRSIKVLLLMAACCFPCVVDFVLYIVTR